MHNNNDNDNNNNNLENLFKCLNFLWHSHSNVLGMQVRRGLIPKCLDRDGRMHNGGAGLGMLINP
jgi:hypothetical protein